MNFKLLTPIFLLGILGFCEGIKVEMSEQEKAALEKFRPLVQDELYNDYMKEDIYLLKYLRAHKLDLNKAAEAMRETHTWRKENDIDNILKEDLSEVFKQNPYTYDGLDNEGGPVVTLIFNNANWDIRKYTVSGQRNLLTRNWDQMLERVDTRIRQLGAKPNIKEDVKANLILDIIGHNPRQHGCLACLPIFLEWMKHTQAYYPENYKSLYLVNAPRVFGPLLEILKPAMAQSTRDLLHVYGPNKKEWAPELLKFIPSDQLSPQLGGTRKL